MLLLLDDPGVLLGQEEQHDAPFKGHDGPYGGDDHARVDWENG